MRTTDLLSKLNIIGWQKRVPIHALLGGIAANLNVLFIGLPGSNKTTFARSLGLLLGRKTRVYDVDKLSPDVLAGELDPDYIHKTSKTIERLVSTISAPDRSNLRGLSGEELEILMGEAKPQEMYKNAVSDYDIIVWDEVRRGTPLQQSLANNISSDRIYNSKTIKAKIIACTNTTFDHLYEFDQAFLNRFHMIIPCVSFADMDDDEQVQFIKETGNILSNQKAITQDQEFVDRFNLLEKELSLAVDKKVKDNVALFITHLKTPLLEVLPKEDISGRYINNLQQTLYTALKTAEIMDGVDLNTAAHDTLYEIIYNTFLSSLYLEKLDPTNRAQIENAFFVAFSHTYNQSTLSLLDLLKSVTNIFTKSEHFVRHIREHEQDRNFDIVGIQTYLRNVRDYTQNNDALRYIFYKWLHRHIKVLPNILDKDIINHFEDNAKKLQKKMDEYLKTSSKIELTSNALSPEFIENIYASAADKIFSSINRDPVLYEQLLTVLTCFTPELVSGETKFVREMYVKLATISNIV